MWTHLWPIWLSLWLGAGLRGVNAGGRYDDSSVVCEPIKAHMCDSLGYNQTGMPNFGNSTRQADALTTLETFIPLVMTQCSPDIQFFLCAVYIPVCQSDVEIQPLIGPCRPLCERVRQRCEKTLMGFNSVWPPVLACHRFPETNSHDHMCMERSEDDRRDIPKFSVSSSSIINLQSNPLFMQKAIDTDHHQFHDLAGQFSNSRVMLNKLILNGQTSAQNEMGQTPSGRCQNLRSPSHWHFVERLDRCVPECGSDVQFREEDKALAEKWMIALTVISSLTGVFTLVSFLLDSNRHQYPERAICFITLAALGYNFGYVIRLIVGREATSCFPSDQNPDLLLLTVEGHRNPACFTVFLFLNFFSCAITSWWLITTLTWFLSITTKLTAKRLSHYVTYYHIFGWGWPASITILLAVMKEMHGEEFSGTCGPAAQDDYGLLVYVILPESIQFSLSLLLLLIGLIVMLSKAGAEDGPTGFKDIAMKMGLYTILFVIAKGLILATFIYEYSERSSWLNRTSTAEPTVDLFLLRLCMGLLFGVLSGTWIISQDTKQVWKREVLHFCCWSKNKKVAYPTVAYSRQSQPKAEGNPESQETEYTTLHSTSTPASQRQLQRQKRMQQQVVQLPSHHQPNPQPGNSRATLYSDNHNGSSGQFFL
ncbi:hypothetical protein TCAL_08713 [Tigriopus californicus]|uniref:Uncharacterized protein n=1 Tax=Tigriopus californicus TaxID=6832 RepID=A0A553P0K5_TIGCA|nr:frizzled-4-like isoform X1 [Tigriopus californicus]TRY71210.1 hypothetical protein TCAL_08713 [Tigriopus californicus]